MSIHSKLTMAPGATALTCAFVLATPASAAELPAYDPSGRAETPPAVASGALVDAFDSRAGGACAGALAVLDSRAVMSATSQGANVNARRPGTQLIFR